MNEKKVMPERIPENGFPNANVPCDPLALPFSDDLRSALMLGDFCLAL
jgi:hypothetical protein